MDKFKITGPCTLSGEVTISGAKNAALPILFASGYGQRGLIDGFQDAHVLTKPFDIDGLAQVVAKARLHAN